MRIIRHCSKEHLESVVGPTSELHLTVLVVEGEPGDVDGAGGLEHAGGDVGAQTLAGHDHVGRERGVERFTRTEADNNISIIMGSFNQEFGVCNEPLIYFFTRVPHVHSVNGSVPK